MIEIQISEEGIAVRGTLNLLDSSRVSSNPKESNLGAERSSEGRKAEGLPLVATCAAELQPSQCRVQTT